MGHFAYLLSNFDCFTWLSSTLCPAHVTPPELSPSPCVARTRTPPDLKWMLNERAALAGKAEKILRRIGGLTELVAALESPLALARNTLAGALRARHETLSTLQALDATIALAHGNVRPDAAGTVFAWSGKYGKRGALKAFLVQALQEASPCTLTTVYVITAATQHFGLQFETAAEKLAFRDTVRQGLRKLRDVDGTVESLHERRLGSPAALWRWRAIRSLADLAALSSRQEASGEQDEYAAHGEMASQ